MIPGYNLGNIIYQGSKSVIYSAKEISTGKAYVVKMRSGDTTPATVAKLRQEFEIASHLEFEGIVKAIDLVEYERGLALVSEDFGGKSLALILKESKLETSLFLELALKINEALGFIHAQGIIHKDIKPDNVIVNLNTRQVKLTDFGIASRLSRENAEMVAPKLLQGTLSYIAPEQTGRMNRAVDFRSDFYSLGATFYEMLIGRPPFKQSDDAMQIIHAHIAVEPEAPHRLSAQIPEAISRIILKLLSKNAEDRYQSSFGLKADLEECLTQLKGGSIQVFPLATRDISENFQIPQKLYGRENEITQLMRAFYSLSSGSSDLLLVSGYSGIGKSSIIHEVHKPIAEARGNFIAGKYDQFKRDTPYAAIIQAFQGLIHQILTESSDVVSSWQDRILTALGENAQVIIEVIPEVELILGKQPPVAALSPAETQNRLNHTFVHFVRVFATAEHPLVLFIDDLQWADLPSLKLMQLMMTTSDLTNFLLLGAYRDNEVSVGSPLMQSIDAIKDAGRKIRVIHLSPLQKEHVHQLVGDTISNHSEEMHPLANLCFEKTNGNPFFLGELLKELYRTGNLFFETTKGEWAWDIKSIYALSISDNVVELMSDKLAQFPGETIRTLQLAACIGANFDLRTLSAVREEDPTKTIGYLQKALASGIVIPLGDNYRYVDKLASEEIQSVAFRFAHDRIQQAAYTTIPEEERKPIHRRIGQLLQQSLSSKEFEDRIFEVVEHLNIAADLITDKLEKIALAKLNYQASLRASRSSAFSSALNALLTAVSLVDDSLWTEDHDIAWNIWKEKAYHEYACAKTEDCEASIKTVLQHSKKEEEKVPAYTIYLNVLYQMNKHDEGIVVARLALKELGIRIPKKANKLHVALQYVAFRLRLGLRQPAKLIDLPENKSKRAMNICTIIFDAIPSFYQVQPDGMGYIAIVMASVCLRHGNSIYSAFAYAMAGIIHGGVLKLFRGASKFYEVALNVNEKYPNLNVKARVNFLMGNFGSHWVYPLEKHSMYVKTALECAVEAGVINWADYSVAFNRTQAILLNSRTLPEVEQENKKLMVMHEKHRDHEVIMNHKFLLSFIHRLMDGNPVAPMKTIVTNSTLQSDSETPITSNTTNEPRPDAFDLEAYEKEKMGAGNFTMKLYYFGYRMLENYLAQSYGEALRYAKLGSSIVLEVLETSLAFLLRYYYLLTILGQYKSLSIWKWLTTRPRYLLHRSLLWWYAKNAPENFKQHYLLVKAEEARIHGSFSDALNLYEHAITEAEKTKYLQQLALANELAGNFLLENNHSRLGRAYIADARYHYELWGARSQVARIDAKYPGISMEFRKSKSLQPLHTHTQSIGQTTTMIGSALTETMESGGLTGLDMNTAIKAAQAISGEIKLEKLLGQLMHIIMENAGAQRGVLLLEKDGRLFAEAEQEGLLENPRALLSTPVEEVKLSHGLVRFVQKTRQSVVLDNAATDGQFVSDVYIKEKQIKSLLCSPIVHQSKLIGLVYLENNLADSVFTPERLKIVNLLASQAAISLENATLYSNLEEKVRERTKELSESLQQVQNLKSQQDADYFLTALLIKPLSESRAASENVTVDFFLRQKKQFQFRHWREEIGGDLCMSSNITLFGQKYTVFGNADAMGKSMQGAGGALVLGSVFQAIIDRTTHLRSFQDQFPERWLKNAFIEMHRVFETFDGSMLVSLFLGLIDEETGLMYYVSAEHPWSVLYRDNKAKFINHEKHFYKLGFPDLSGQIAIQTMQLRMGDIIIAGSDGRDDVLVPFGDSTVMNEDERLFLRRVEQGNGDLEAIAKLIQQSGVLTDDLSMVRVHYMDPSRNANIEPITNHIEIIEKARLVLESKNFDQAIALLEPIYSPHHPQKKEILRLIIRALVAKKEYLKASQVTEEYIKANPKDSEAIYIAAYCFKRSREFKKATDYGERLRLRNPNHLQNLINLAELYAHQDIFERSLSILNDVTAKNPHHQQAIRKKEMIERRRNRKLGNITS